MEKTLEKNPWIWLIIIALIYFAYQWVIVNPQKTLDAVNKAKQDAQSNLNWCLSQADLTYTSDWNTACLTSGVNKREAGCTLSQYNSGVVNGYHAQARSDCFKQYPQL